jgi:hypothetical protein
MTAQRTGIEHWFGWLLYALMQGSIANEPTAVTPEPSADEPSVQTVEPRQAPPLIAGIEQALLERLDAGTLGAGYQRLENADGSAFLVRYVPGLQSPRATAVLVVPGRDRLISADPFIDALLTELPANGWTTLAVQLPLGARDGQSPGDTAETAVTRTRLDTALARLLTDGVTAIVVVGLDDGAALLAKSLSTGFGQSAVQAFASRGRWRGEMGDAGLPLLELLPTADTQATALAMQREHAALRAGLPYRRQLYSGLGCDFAGASAALARDLRGWITKLPAPG